MSASQLHVRRATTADADTAASVLADAFAGYEWTTWTVDTRDHRDRIRALQLLTIEHIGLPFGEVWLAGAAPGESVKGVAVWNHSRAAAAVDWTSLATEVARLEGDRHDAARAAEELAAMARPTAEHLYLGTIGTVPTARRGGVATALLQPLLRAADASRLPVVLETSAPANLHFYERFGFTSISHQQIPGGGPPLWTLQRDPA